MLNEEESIKKLAEGFFKSLKCKVIWKEKVLFVDDIPKDFERDYGKNGPYQLVFNRDDYDKYENSELIAKGSVLLKIIANYLEERGQTTLLKLDFNPDFAKLISETLNLNGYSIKNMSNKVDYRYILRFIFLSNFQYLNEREQVNSIIYVKDKDVLEDFEIDNFNSVEGKKEELNVKDIKEEYGLAKEKLKEHINEKTKEIVERLNFSLESAMNRIKSHYLHQIAEFDDEIKRNEETIKNLREKINKNIDVNGNEEKIKKLEQNIEKLKHSEDRERIEKEKDMYIADEKSKHSLNLNNKLVNTSIIYYPIYQIDFSVLTKSKHTKHVNFTFNPVEKTLTNIVCENCGEKVVRLNICSGDHIYCEGCGGKCVCGSEICEKCDKVGCNVCGRPICSKCGSKCSICNKSACSSDMCRDSLTSKHICNHCAKYCSVCNKFADKRTFAKCPICNNEMCSRCSKLDFKLKKKVCVNCFKPVSFGI